jgi:hypothetical protein
VVHRYTQVLGALAAVIVLGAALPAPASAQAVDEKTTRIKAALEREGLTVISLRFLPEDRDGPPHWFAYTQATYPRPNWPDVAQQALRTWLAVNSVVASDDPKTMIFSGQAWTRYVVQLAQRNETVSQFAEALRGAKSDADRNRAAQIVLKRFLVRIYDVEAGRFVDVKDFVNKNFMD